MWGSSCYYQLHLFQRNGQFHFFKRQGLGKKAWYEESGQRARGRETKYTWWGTGTKVSFFKYGPETYFQNSYTSAWYVHRFCPHWTFRFVAGIPIFIQTLDMAYKTYCPVFLLKLLWSKMCMSSSCNNYMYSLLTLNSYMCWVKEYFISTLLKSWIG